MSRIRDNGPVRNKNIITIEIITEFKQFAIFRRKGLMYIEAEHDSAI